MFDWEEGGGAWLVELKKRDLEGVLARFSDDQVQDKALDAVAFIFDMVPAARRRLDSGALSERAWIKTVTDVVMRVLRNPAGHQSESDGVYNYSDRSTVASGDMWLTKNDLAVLNGSDGTMPGTIRVEAARGWGR